MALRARSDKSSPPARCVHCGDPLPRGSKTKDHVFPKTWFPDSTPANVQRWTVPSCRKCNGELGAVEKDLFIRLALCSDPRKIEAAGLSKRVMRSLGIRVTGLAPGEHRARAAHKSKIVRDISPHGPGGTTLPGLGLHTGFPDVAQYRINISAQQLDEVAKKIVRGCEYVLGDKRIVDPPYELSIHFVEDSEISNVLQIFAPFDPITLGPGFRIQRAAAQDDPKSCLYRVHLWDTWKFFGAIIPPE